MILTYIVPATTDEKILPITKISDNFLSQSIFIRKSPSEYSPASFVLKSSQDQKISISVTDLKGKNGKIAKSNVDIRVVKCWYQGGNDKHSVTVRGRYLTPELLLKDDSIIKVIGDECESNPKGRNYIKVNGCYINTSDDSIKQTTRLIIPISERPIEDADTLQPVLLKQDLNKQFWVTVYTHVNTPSGDYLGTIKVKAGNKTILTICLNVTVLPIELSNTNIEYSIYYRGKITEDGSISSENKTVEQFTAELQDMYNHGITNPTIYPYIGSYSLLLAHETSICQELEARQNAGIDNTNLYFCGYIAPGNIPHFKNSFAQYGVKELYQYGPDEQDLNTTERRDVITAEHNAGGKHFCAEWIKSYAESVPDILDLVIAGNVWSDVAASYHSYGHKVFLYNRPQAVPEFPRTFRLNYGLRLWQNNYDGAMDYAYQHSMRDIWNDFDHTIRDHCFTYPTANGVIDTIQWEGFREGVTDMRYLATLQAAITANPGEAATTAQGWLDTLKTTDLSSADLDAIRATMIDHILAIQP